MNLEFMISKTWHFVKAVGFQMLYFCIKPFISKKKHWVISGHRGRMYLDNSAALHQYVSLNTKQSIVWITKNPSDFEFLSQAGYQVVWKNSFQARMLILTAQVLIYSHGEDDLDSHILYWNHLAGLRIYLNHSMNLIKTGQMAQKQVENFSPKELARFRSKITRFDYILSSSETEKEFFKRSFIEKDSAYVLGGGAHLDKIFEMKNRMLSGELKPSKLILYFPTFRDLPKGKLQLIQVLNELVNNEELHYWLKANEFEFAICNHINSQSIQVPKFIEEHIRVYSPNSIIDLLEQCSAFISDYSGLIADYLVLEKPFVAFPFDLDDYLKFRSFYTPYRDFTYGHEVRSAEALVKLITSEKIFETEEFEEHANQLREKFFPYKDANYSKSGFEMIQKLLDHQTNSAVTLKSLQPESKV